MSAYAKKAPSPEVQAVYLEQCGWQKVTTWIWKAPSGDLWLGPHGAWKEQKARESKQQTEEVFAHIRNVM